MALIYTLPVFNLVFDLWRLPNAPPAPPDSSPDGQFYFTPKGQYDVTPGTPAAFAPPIYLRVPLGTDIQPGDVVEVPQLSGWLYDVRFTDRVHLGFPNEYFLAILEQQVVGPPPPPPPSGGVLMETTGFVLMETIGHVLME